MMSERVGEEPEELAGDAGRLVAQGEALMRAQNDTIVKVARERPRDEDRVLAAAVRELERLPEEAARAYYSIPYRDTGKTVLVEGPSIHAAMALARRWGNCVVEGMIVGEDPTGVTVAGSFTDFETMVLVRRPLRVGRFYRGRDGRTHELRDQRLVAAIQSGVSKAIRNAILAALPAGVVQTYYGRAKELVAERSKLEPVLAAFGALGVTREQLEGYTGEEAGAWSPVRLAELRGLWQAIKDGMLTAEEAFAGGRAPEAEPAGNGQGALDALAEAEQAAVPEASETELAQLRGDIAGLIAAHKVKDKVAEHLYRIHGGASRLEAITDAGRLRSLKTRLEALLVKPKR